MSKIDNKKEKSRIMLVNIFTILYVISFTKIVKFESIRYLAIVLLQVICLYDMRNEKIIFNKKAIILILVLVITMCFSLFKTGYTVESVMKMVTILDLFFVTLIILPNYLRKCDFNNIIKNIRNDLLIILMLCFIIYHNDYSISYDTTRMGSLIRLKCGFWHPNTLSIFSFIGITLTIYLIGLKYKVKTNIVILCFFLYIISEANSRTALYCVIIFILLVLFSYICKNRQLKPIVYAISIIATCGIVFIGGTIIEGLTFEKINQLLSYRLTYILNSIEVLISNNALLTGMGAFRNSATFDTNSVMLDNGYFNYIYQYGIVSFGVLICFLFYNFVQINKNANKNITIFVRNIYIVFLIYSFFENILLNIGSFFAIFIYFIIYILPIYETESKENTINRRE